jgi:hypothetical protein
LCRVDQPEAKYAKSGDLSIAYQVVGDGPIDILYVPDWVLASTRHGAGMTIDTYGSVSPRLVGSY